jgi:uncharacterized Zn finger protein (UPF0148 family)
MRKIILILLVLTVIPAIMSFARAQEKEAGAIPDTTNLHFTGMYCAECHIKVPKKGDEKLLKYDGDYSQLCKCHGYTPGSYIHPVDITPSADKRSMIPEDLPLKDGKIVCSTCHDMYMQCQDDDETEALNRRFLRGAPYMKRTALCFRCHDEKQYVQLDPHNQIMEDGTINHEKCLYCHLEMPDEKTQHYDEVKLIGKLEVLCFRCHYKQSKLHPINANHLRIPSEAILANMLESEKKLGVILPLDREGQVTCPTCHNPHERGVLPKEDASSHGASEKYRLRLADQNLQICIACHKDKFQNMQKTE